MENNNVPRVLILSNTPFNLSDSNGRVMGLLLKGIPNEMKLQLCIQGNFASAELIDYCYRITDFEIVKAAFKISVPAYRMPKDNNSGFGTSTIRKKVKRTPLSMLLRDFVWNISLKKTDFFSIACDFKPNVVIWQYGDSGFMANLAVFLSKKCNAKLIIYSTEDYYFKDWDYLSRKKHNILYAIFQHEMRSSTRKAMTFSNFCICNTPQLASRFEKEFDIRTKVIMQSANEISDNKRKHADIERNNTIIYAGNLGLNRHISLIAIARALYKVNPSINFEIYGRATENVMSEFAKEPNIFYKGFVSYETVLQKNCCARLIVHAESFEPFYKKDLEAAFSTKIPDSLASGTPLLLFAPDNLAETQYLEEKKCAFVCTNSDSLERILSIALNDKSMRREILDNCESVVSANHNLVKNQEYMLHLLNDCIS